ncbi:MAG TPA: Zn-dependent oxidoreductase [Phycisphaerae bacterium]|nr:Zn-dependent oxidoreductase [Phycisphaerae bacterium]
MWAIRVEKPGDLALVEVAEPAVGPEQLLVRIRRTGICGSDMHIFHGRNPFARYPRVIGHEAIGTVAVIGPDVEGFATGDRVVIDPVVSCGVCHACRIGRPNVCRNLQVIGVHRDGGMSEFCLIPAANAVKVPETLSERAAVMAEPYSIAANIMLRSEADANDTALIYGAGMVGLSSLQAAAARGVRCIVADIEDRRLERARALGAARVVNSKRESLEEVVQAETAGYGVTLVIDGAGAPGILEQAVQLTGPAGRIMVLNFQPGTSAIPQSELVKKELSLLGSRLNRRLIPAVLEWFESRKVDPEKLVTQEFPFHQVQDAFRLIEEHPEAVCKVQLVFA